MLKENKVHIHPNIVSFILKTKQLASPFGFIVLLLFLYCVVLYCVRKWSVGKHKLSNYG